MASHAGRNVARSQQELSQPSPGGLHAPVFIIGAGRSGTTLLADLVGMHPDFHKLAEKRYLWMYGAYWRGHDIRTAEDVTPCVRAYILDFFARMQARSSTERLVEKTPSNCFRISFIAALFPQAQFIHIVRDGRAVAFSSVRAFMGERYVSNDDRREGRRSPLQRLQYLMQRWPELPRRFRERDLPPSGWLPYAFKKGLDVLQVLIARKPPVWGARYPGIYADRSAYTPLEVAGIQWRESVARAVSDLARYVPEPQQLSLRYEDLLQRPHATLTRIFTFLGKDVDEPQLDRIAREVRNDGDDIWKRGLDASEHATLIPHIGPLLHVLGYGPTDDVGWMAELFSSHQRTNT